MQPLMNFAQVLRSKNAGAFVLTLDIIFKTEEDYLHIIASGALHPSRIAQAYRVKDADVSIIPYPEVFSIKITLPRTIGSGDIPDTDVYGAQQHVPLMLLEMPSRTS